VVDVDEREGLTSVISWLGEDLYEMLRAMDGLYTCTGSPVFGCSSCVDFSQL
jgi:hypothetical protein